MKEEYKDFIGIYDESVPVELCNEFVENFEEGKKNETIIEADASPNPIHRKDEALFVTSLSSTIYPRPPVEEYFQFLNLCFTSSLSFCAESRLSCPAPSMYPERYTILSVFL